MLSQSYSDFEFIIINACGLKENTKKGLRIKEKLENLHKNSSLLQDVDDSNSEMYDSRDSRNSSLNSNSRLY